jgi:hypothetical protein
MSTPVISSPSQPSPLCEWSVETLRRRARLSLGAAQRASASREGPAVLRLRMLELSHALRLGAVDAQARVEADTALAALREAVLTRPSLSFADAEARLRTLGPAKASCGEAEAVK